MAAVFRLCFMVCLFTLGVFLLTVYPLDPHQIRPVQGFTFIALGNIVYEFYLFEKGHG